MIEKYGLNQEVLGTTQRNLYIFKEIIEYHSFNIKNEVDVHSSKKDLFRIGQEVQKINPGNLILEEGKKVLLGKIEEAVLTGMGANY